MEQVITREERIPLSHDDRGLEKRLACIPIPPTLDERWFILDSNGDRKTVWGRWRDLCKGHT
jgi:hypothetical protein